MGFIVNAEVLEANGRAERDAALVMQARRIVGLVSYSRIFAIDIGANIGESIPQEVVLKKTNKERKDQNWAIHSRPAFSVRDTPRDHVEWANPPKSSANCTKVVARTALISAFTSR